MKSHNFNIKNNIKDSFFNLNGLYNLDNIRRTLWISVGDNLWVSLVDNLWTILNRSLIVIPNNIEEVLNEESS